MPGAPTMRPEQIALLAASDADLLKREKPTIPVNTERRPALG
jgi:hypothetical protein